MQKKFLTNLALLLFLNLLVKPFWVLGIDRSVQNVVGTAEFGFYFSILNFSFLFSILLDMGITNFNNRNIAQHSQLLNKHISSILIIKILLMTAYLVVIFGVGLLIRYNQKQFEILVWVGLNQFLLSLILYLRSNISGLLLFRTDSFLSVFDRLLMILFCSILLWGNVTEKEFRIEWFVFAQTLAYFITALIAFVLVVKKSSFKRLNWNWPFFLLILKKSFPYAVLVLLMAFYYRIDAVMIERLLPGELGDIQAGIYAQAYRLLDAANMIAYLFAVLLLPIFAWMIRRKDNTDQIVRLSFSILITTSIIVAVTSHFYCYEWMELLYPKHADEQEIDFLNRINQSAKIFSILMYGFVAISTTYVFGTLLTANGSLKQLNIIAAAGMIISIALNLMLIPVIQATGSAWAILFSQFVTAIAQVIVAVKIFKLEVNRKYLIRIAVFIAGVYVIAILSARLPFHWLYSVMILVTASLFLSFSLRLLDLKKLFSVIRARESL
ncbi:MAG: oligosaccharide flippase family protein [Bacteroidales bacterium]|nr:oligosaccharide flippase family protein [Bacteroidales bacterium]